MYLLIKVTTTVFLLSILIIDLSFCVEFNQTSTGVAFSAYLKRNEGKGATAGIPGWKTYTWQDMRAMLEVISTRFSKIATFGVGADNVAYIKNQTYHDSNAQFMTAEAAAKLNKERGNASLIITMGIWQSPELQQMNTEIEVALESVQKANEIFDGTVTGLVLSHDRIDFDLARIKQTLRRLKELRTDPVASRLKLGSRQKCNDIVNVDPEEVDKAKMAEVKRNVINESDFIICTIEPASHNKRAGAKDGFFTVKNDLLQFRREFKTINPNIEVMGQTGWASKGKKEDVYENIENLKDYWMEADAWAHDHNFTMWMLEAFDNPWKDWLPNAAHFGWWKLRSNSKTGQISGYAEKIFEPPDLEEKVFFEEKVRKQTTNINIWIYVGVGLAVAFILIVLGAVAFLYFRVQTLQESITNDDIKEFMYGLSDEAAAQQGGNVVESALKFPYDKSYEIAKEKLKIRRDVMLGSGQFGCVYRALIDNEEQTEVALKMAKHDCPKNALVGLLSEIKILTYLGKHPNIVSIHGAYTGELTKGIVYVATELCPLGSLEDYLRKTQSGTSDVSNNDRYANSPAANVNYINVDETSFNESNINVSFSDMVRWSHEIACGMEYLGVKHVVHADLSTRNVLLTSDKTAKITDFGLSRRLYDYTNYVKKQQEPLPWRWMAIESLKRLEFSSKSDVWSYGVTLWEIFSMGDLPYPGLSWNLDFVENLVNGLRMNSPPYANEAVYGIMVSCWNIDSKQRPTFTDLKLSTGQLFDESIGQNDNN